MEKLNKIMLLASKRELVGVMGEHHRLGAESVEVTAELSFPDCLLQSGSWGRAVCCPA